MASASGYSRTIVRQGDANVAGGVITDPKQGSVYANGRLVACDGSQGSSDAECEDGNVHCAFHWIATPAGSRTVFAEGRRVLAEGDVDTCGHPRAVGSPNVYAG